MQVMRWEGPTLVFVLTAFSTMELLSQSLAFIFYLSDALFKIGKRFLLLNWSFTISGELPNPVYRIRFIKRLIKEKILKNLLYLQFPRFQGEEIRWVALNFFNLFLKLIENLSKNFQNNLSLIELIVEVSFRRVGQVLSFIYWKIWSTY